MNDLAFTAFSDLPQIPVSGQLTSDEFDFAFSPDLLSGDDILVDSPRFFRDPATPEPGHAADLTRPARMERHLSSLEKSVAGSHSYPVMGEDMHGTLYLPIQNATPLQPPPPSLHATRYASPSGSQGGDMSATGSLMSDQPWMVFSNQFPSTTPSPMIDNFQFSHIFSPASFSPTAAGSYCASECSVNPNDLQHAQQIHTPPPEKDFGAVCFGHPAHFDPQPSEQWPAFADPNSLLAYDNVPFDSDPAIDPLLAEHQHDPYEPEEVEVEPPRKRVKHERYTPEEDFDSMLQVETPPGSPKKKSGSKLMMNTNKTRPAFSKPAKKQSTTKATTTTCSSSSSSPSSSASRKKTTQRQFPCVFAPYGCNLVFVSKNEWKRHVMSQHLQLGFFRCDVGKCNINNAADPSPSSSSSSSSSSLPSPGHLAGNSSTTPFNPTLRTPNDFNRKDLFTQHQRRMHTPWRVPSSPPHSSNAPSKDARAAFEASLEAVRTRCWIEQRQPPQFSRCTYCSAEFRGAGCWEARMEHVGKHCENGDEEEVGVLDVGLRDWAVREGVVREPPSSFILLLSLPHLKLRMQAVTCSAILPTGRAYITCPVRRG
ncbi:hypothetical protein LOZ53_000362 [Ophidiomyces ophidiicola]|nr:hypothetical protein LOZ53_000362 [Ophidiomyces ophidiicola]